MGSGRPPAGQPRHHAPGHRPRRLDAKKKSLSAGERDEAARAAWRAAAAALDPAALVFVDECGTHVAHTRAYARAPRGRRAGGAVPRNRGRVTTLIASLTPAGPGPGPARTREGGTTKDAFLAYLREDLAPTLAAGQVVVLDNLGAHRATGVREAVEARGARLLYLPGYSPDFNPIELAFGKLKGALRGAGARTRDDLRAAIGAALAGATEDDARAFYAHCGFPVTDQPFRQP